MSQVELNKVQAKQFFLDAWKVASNQVERMLYGRNSLRQSEGERDLITAHTAGIVLLMVGCDILDLSLIHCWKVPMAKNPKVESTCTGTGMAFEHWVSLLNWSSNMWHNCKRRCLGRQKRLKSHSSLSIKRSLWSRKPFRVLHAHVGLLTEPDLPLSKCDTCQSSCLNR